MRLWLDDLRTAPDGWCWVRRAGVAIEVLARGGVEVVSLDHDLGAGTGYELLLWVERSLALETWRYGPLPEFRIHSANPVGRARMQSALGSIERLALANSALFCIDRSPHGYIHCDGDAG